jgi:hypothetical protein
MHKKYGKEDVVTISVTLDDPKDAKAKKNVPAFLKEQGAAFQNFWLDEEEEVWQAKLEIGGPPLQVVFGKDGKAAGRFPGRFNEVEELVKKLLESKP